MNRGPLIALVLLAPLGPAFGQDSPVLVEKIISRENPAFQVDATLTFGRDGRVYLSSGGNTSYVLRMNPDGSDKLGGSIVYAASNATGNAQGVIASANGHFAHKVALYDRNFSPAQEVNDFLVSDQVGWDAPAHVEAGASGDFYAVDQHRNRIVRLSPSGKTVTSYPVPREPEGGQGLVEDFRVSEGSQTLFVLNRAGQIRAIGFDGKKRWGASFGVSRRAGGFDVDEQGAVYVIDRHADAVRKIGPDGKPAGESKLRLKDRRPGPADHGWTELRIGGGDVLLKRRHPTELFQRYDWATGEFKNAVEIEHERLTISYPRATWTAGESIPFKLEFKGQTRAGAPLWNVWARPLHDLEYRPLLLKDGSLHVPQDYAGLYQIKVTPELGGWQRGRAPEYLVRSVVEIRQPGGKGVVAVVTPENRTSFARGEEIPFEVTGESGAVRLVDGESVLAILKDRRIPKSLTATLRPGRYRLVPEAPGATAVAQSIVIGPGREEKTFQTMQYGDYGALYPQAGPWEALDLTEAHASRAAKMGVALFVDRIGSHLHANDVAWSGQAAQEFSTLSNLHPDFAAKARGASPLLQTMAAYGARGIQEMSILMNMDAGLPLGAPGFDHRKPDELVKTIDRVTQALKPFPAFRGWAWTANWWIFEGRGSKAAKTPAQKVAYEVALKRARETGAWDPVLDDVSNIRLGWAVEAQELFNKTLRSIAPGLVTASASPYRNVESYPPITFSNVDECDLQAQWEQIALPYHAPHSVDFYKRPGKRAWVHPEAWNDAGTGDQLGPTLLSALMRGADAIGISGPMSPWMSGTDGLPHDSRSSHYGSVSVYRALNELLSSYGSWWNTLEPRDPVAIAVSGRMFKIDEWGSGVTGTHFARMLEAWAACLHAHAPATYVFPEDLKGDTFKRFKTILVVGQRVEMEPPLLAAIKDSGLPVYYDGTCRPECVKGFTPLETAFNRFEKDSHPASDDAAYWRFPEYVRSHLPALAKVLHPIVEIQNEEILASERRAEEGRYIFLVNNTTPAIEPGQLWRVTLSVASRVPQVVALKLGQGHIYDAFALREAEASGGAVRADLRSLPGRLFAVLPAPIAQVAVRAPNPIEPGAEVAWSVEVLDDAGKPIRAVIPVRVRLLASDGAVLHEKIVGVGSAGAGGSFRAAINAGAQRIEATELLSGKGAQTGPIESRFGPHLRDVALLGGSSLAVFNAMNWDHNLYAIDLETGKLRWRRRVGQYFAFAPLSFQGGLAVQGFRFDAAEGYQLHLVGTDGSSERRFGLYGLPGRLPHRFVPGILRDSINHFAVPESGLWVASAGDLGVAVWSREGKLLWTDDAWKTERRAAFIAPLGSEKLLVVRGLVASGRDARDGRVLWHTELAKAGEPRAVRVTPDGQTVAVLATTEGGRAFILREGRLAAAHAVGGTNDIDLSPDGSHFAVATANFLKFYSVERGLQWTLGGDDFLRFPRISPDGRRVAGATDLGTLYVADQEGRVLLERDLGAVAVPAWLPNGDLLWGSWMGDVSRLDAHFQERWRTHLVPETEDLRGRILAEERTPLSRVSGWVNSEPSPFPLTPNLLSEKDVRITFVAQQNHIQFTRPTGALVDGKPDAPPEPWLRWGDVGSFAETSPFNYMMIDTFRTQLRVHAITFVEDPAHPESWLRDLKLEAWDAAREKWGFIGELRSDSAVHTHRLATPVESARFRVVFPWGLCGNIRLAEIVFHGEALGSSHPDVIAKRPLAVLFDEGDDLKGYLVTGPLGFRFGDAFSGGRCLALAANAKAAPPFQPPFGHVLPNWDFEIAEKPAPGQYRYLQFAWRAQGPQTRGITVGLWGSNWGEKLLCHAGSLTPEEGSIPRKVADLPPLEWSTVRVDLWDIFRKPVRIRSLSLAAGGGGAFFDQIVLAREEKDLPQGR